LKGEILTVEPLGRETLYEVMTPLGSLRVLDGGSERRFHEADPVAVAVPDDALLVFDKASERRLEQARPVLTEAA
jgi:inositol-phosphate transport system ATP-binding protein